MNKVFSHLLLTVIRIYQNFISPALPGRCRYYPTCSEYGKQAIDWHGSMKGGLLTVKRICRCHPLGGHGVDFVPLPLYRYIFKPINNHKYQSKSQPLLNGLASKDKELATNIVDRYKNDSESRQYAFEQFSADSLIQYDTSNQCIRDSTSNLNQMNPTHRNCHVSRETILYDRGVFQDTTSYVARLNCMISA